MVNFLINWLTTAAVLMIVSYVLPGFQVRSFTAALVAALVVGVVNAVLVPLLNLLTLPLRILTLGLFSFVVSAVGLLVTDALVPGFRVDGLWTAILGAVLIAIVNAGVGLLGGRSFA